MKLFNLIAVIFFFPFLMPFVLCSQTSGTTALPALDVKEIIADIDTCPIYYYTAEHGAMVDYGKPYINIRECNDWRNVKRLVVYGSVLQKLIKEDEYNTTFPFKAEQLPNLKELRVDGQFNNLLTAIAEFKNLVILDLGKVYKLEESLMADLFFPSEFFALKNLSFLNICSNRKLYLPEGFSNLTNLVALSVVNVKEQSPVPSFFIPINTCNLPYLNYIIVDNLSDYHEAHTVSMLNPRIKIIQHDRLNAFSFSDWIFKKTTFSEFNYLENTSEDKIVSLSDSLRYTLKGAFVNSKPDGVWKFYFNGDLIEKRNYKNGLPAGKWCKWSVSGLEEKCVFKKGLLTKQKGKGISYPNFKGKKKSGNMVVTYSSWIFDLYRLKFVYDRKGNLILIK